MGEEGKLARTDCSILQVNQTVMYNSTVLTLYNCTVLDKYTVLYNCTVMYNCTVLYTRLECPLFLSPKLKRVSLNKTPELLFWGLSIFVDFD